MIEFNSCAKITRDDDDGDGDGDGDGDDGDDDDDDDGADDDPSSSSLTSWGSPASDCSVRPPRHFASNECGAIPPWFKLFAPFGRYVGIKWKTKGLKVMSSSMSFMGCFCSDNLSAMMI